MSDTLVRPASVRPHGVAGSLAGAALIVLGLVGALSPTPVGPAWFAAVVPVALLFAVGVLGLRRLADSVAAPRLITTALTVAAAAMTIFALAHAYALVDEDTAIVLFSIFMLVAAAALVVAAIGMFRSGGTDLPRWAVLAAGLWPILAIPAGGAISDTVRFAAIAVWGLTWLVLGATLLRRS